MAIIVGCDFHAKSQQIAYTDTATGEVWERRLEHMEEALEFYRSLPRGVVVGVETSSPCRWFARELAKLGHTLRLGHAQTIAAHRTRMQKHDRADAALILKLLRDDTFPDVWQPSPEMQQQRCLIKHRHGLVQLRTGLINQMRALERSEGLNSRRRLSSEPGRAELLALAVGEREQARRKDLLDLYTDLERRIKVLDPDIEARSQEDRVSRLLRTHPGVGPITAAYFPLVVGDPHRFETSRKLTAYLGLNPREHSSGGRQKLGSITKQGDRMARYLLIEAANTAAQKDKELHRFYVRLAQRRGSQVAKVAVARKLAIRLWQMWLRGIDYQDWQAGRTACSEARRPTGQ